MKRKYNEVILYLAVMSLVVTFLWIYLSVYRAANKPEKAILSPQETRVLDPKLDQEVFQELLKRKF
jgi:uncharacterized heparinase superfamily protein